MDIELREKLANLEHEQWSHWTKYMLDNINFDNAIRWNKQINTPYSKLTEKEKDSDREWANKVIKTITEHNYKKNFRNLGKSELKNKEEVLEEIMDGIPKIELKGCGKMFQPWGKSKEESSWKCGDEWNGEKLFCSECVKGEKSK